jgi:hypothetical protein
MKKRRFPVTPKKRIPALKRLLHLIQPDKACKSASLHEKQLIHFKNDKAMKTKNNLHLLPILTAIIVAPVLGGCFENPVEEDSIIILQEGLRITSGKLLFKNEFEPAVSEFTFCDNDGDCTSPPETRDEIVLLPYHKYECIFVCSGSHLHYANLKVCFTTTSDLSLSINKCSQENQLFEGEVTEWITGNQASGELVLTVTDQCNGCYSITLPVNIGKVPDLD